MGNGTVEVRPKVTAFRKKAPPPGTFTEPEMIGISGPCTRACFCYAAKVSFAKQKGSDMYDFS